MSSVALIIQAISIVPAAIGALCMILAVKHVEGWNIDEHKDMTRGYKYSSWASVFWVFAYGILSISAMEIWR